MLDKTSTKFSHVKRADTPWQGEGLRDFFLYKDLGIADATAGRAKFMYEDQVTLVEAGDCVHQRPGVVHYLFDYSPDMEYLEIVGPADFKSIDVPPLCEVPAPIPWK